MAKFLLAAFRGDLMCFAHVMLNAVDLRKAGHEVEIMLEGESTKIPKLFADDPKANFYPLWNQIVEGKYITAVCKACSQKMGGFEAAEKLGLPMNGDMSGHPPFSKWLAEGFQIITF
jgi:hypothetical protein